MDRLPDLDNAISVHPAKHRIVIFKVTERQFVQKQAETTETENGQ